MRSGSGHGVPINLYQDNCYFLFGNFLISIWMENCYTFKGQVWEAEPWETVCVFLAIGDTFFFLSLLKCRARRPNQRQPNTKVRAKGVDLTWSQVCSPLLQFPSVHAHSTVLAAVGVGRVGICPNADCLLPWEWMDKRFYSQRERFTCRNICQHWHSSWDWSLVVWSASSWLSIVTLQFQGWFIPISQGPFSELW